MNLLQIYWRYLPLLWLLGLRPFVYYVSFLMDIKYIFNTEIKRCYITKIIRLLLFSIIFFYLFRIPILVIKGDFNLTYILSSIQGLFGWLVILLVFSVWFNLNIRNDKRLNKLKIINQKLLKWTMFFGYIGLFINYFFPKFSGSFSIKNPVMRLIQNSPLNVGNLTNMIDTQFYKTEVILSSLILPRLKIFSVYPNAFAVFIMALIILYLNWKKRSSIFVVCLSIPILFFSLSRIIIFGLIISSTTLLFLILILKIIRHFLLSFNFRFFKKTLSRTIIIFFIVLIGMFSIIMFGSKVNKLRSASSNTRFLLYRISITETIKNYPIIGYGYKPRNIYKYGTLHLGSHSTLVGMFVKLGIIGLIIYLIYIGLIIGLVLYQLLIDTLFTKGYKKIFSNLPLFIGLLTFILWQVFEDMDAPLNIPILWGIMTAELVLLRLKLKKTDNYKVFIL